MGFRELFQLAHGRRWTADEERAFAALTQDARNAAVKELAARSGCVRTEDRLGSDGVVYTAFWQEGSPACDPGRQGPKQR